MCGIAGFVSLQQVSDAASVLRRMTAVLRHRGPDGDGYYQDSLACLGHRRLSIIDLAAGAQPMTNEDERLWVTYNGEVYNHAQLRSQLQAAGHQYRTRCDTETLLHAYEEHGTDSVRLFRGMFSFAIWDKTARTLFCARDRLGIKPFYYYFDSSNFLFASEIKALLQHPLITPAFFEPALPEYLAFGYLSGEQTLFRGIRQLLPGHRLLLAHNREQLTLQVERYWDVPLQETSAPRPDEPALLREFQTRLEDAVQVRLMSDVPLGMFLSGGLDSSVIAALMQRMVKQPVRTFAVGYPEAAYSEIEYARQVSRHIGTKHREVAITQQEFFEALPRLIWHEDEPITWPSSVSLYFVSQLAAKDVKVVLTGEGSDELLAGYSRYYFHTWNQKWANLYSFTPVALRKRIASIIHGSSLISASTRRKLLHSFLGRGGNLESLYLDNFYAALDGPSRRSVLPNLNGGHETACEHFLHCWNSRPGASLLSRMLYADQKTYLAELLMKQDRMSMAASIESRVPFLDHPFVEFAASLPDTLKLRGQTGKYILKKAAEKLLPSEIIYRKKMGFPTPLRQWLRSVECRPLLAPLLSGDSFLAAYLDRAAIDGLLKRHESGREECTDAVWRLLNLNLWGEIFITGRHDSALEGARARKAVAAG